MTDWVQIATGIAGTIGGVTGAGSVVIVTSLFRRTKDLEAQIKDCHDARTAEAVARADDRERIGRLEGFKEATDILAGATHEVAKAIESWRPPTGQYEIKSDGSLTEKRPRVPPPIPKPRGTIR